MGWSKTRQEALKILGDGAEVPELPSAITKANAEVEKVQKSFIAVRDQLEEKLLALDNAHSALMNAAEQLRGKIEKNDFNLDRKKDGKKIDEARKLLLADIDENLDRFKANDKAFSELGRHLAQLWKYEPSSGSL